jgi:HEAT repeat protein
MSPGHGILNRSANRADDQSVPEEKHGWIGPIGPIEITDELTARRQAATAGAERAQKLITVDEHLAALRSEPDAWTRLEIVPRLEARGRDDSRTIPALITALGSDPSELVRNQAAMALVPHCDDERVREAFAHALTDADADVRWSAAFGLSQRST